MHTDVNGAVVFLLSWVRGHGSGIILVGPCTMHLGEVVREWTTAEV